MRRSIATSGLSAAAALALAAPLAVHAPLASAAQPLVPALTEGGIELLTDPFLQAPRKRGVNVVWMTEVPGSTHQVLTGWGVEDLTTDQLATTVATGRAPQGAGIRVHRAESSQLSRTVEDAGSYLPPEEKPSAEDGIVARDVFRHEAVVRGIRDEVPYRVVSTDGSQFVLSETFRLSPQAEGDEAQSILLTSDHQAMINTPANLQVAADTIGEIDAVFLAGDLVNQPDRASEWFDDTRGSAFFPVLQGNAGRVGTDGRLYEGAPIIQSALLYPAVGNHEVQGRVDGHTSIGASFNNPVPKDVAQAEYEKVAAEVNPTDDPAVEAQWIEDNSFSTRTYEEIFTLPAGRSGTETYYATTVGNVRLISLYSTRIWRGTANNADPATRTSTSRYQESAALLDQPLAQGYGEFVFEGLERGSAQYRWLERELASKQYRKADYAVVMLHEGPQGLGDNVGPAFAEPQRIEETDAEGKIIGVRYEYPPKDNVLTTELQPLLEEAGVDLVYNGHSHLWNRFQADSGTSFLESSNTGNSYGAFHELSGLKRHVPGAPWDASFYPAQGNPGGLEPIVPTVQPLTNAEGTPLPYLYGNQYAAFTQLDSETGVVTTWVYDLAAGGAEPYVLDRFSLQ